MYKLRPSIKGLVTDRNTNICCLGFILALFKALQPINLILNNTLCYNKLFPVWKVEILQVTINRRTSDSLHEELRMKMAREKFLRKCFISMERIVVSTLELSTKMFFSLDKYRFRNMG